MEAEIQVSTAHASPDQASPLARPNDGTSTEVEAGGVGNDEPGLTFADLGIPTGPQLAETVTGKRRRLAEFSKMEIAFLVISGVAILATTIFTIYKLATVDKKEPDFVFALVVILNSFFCAFYVVHGLRRERPYEIFILVAATIIVVCYLIINYSVSNRGPVKLVRLIAACVLGPVMVVMGGMIGKEYLSTGKLIFRTVGAKRSLQKACKIMHLFEDLLKLDLQLGGTMVILILVNGVNIKTLDIVVLIVGVVVTIGWFILGHLLVRYENKIMTCVFWGFSPIELGYVIYKVYKAIDRLEDAPALASCSLTAGILAALTHIAVIVVSSFVFRNFGIGLKEKAFGKTES